jgi:hypothetical protein
MIGAGGQPRKNARISAGSWLEGAVGDDGVEISTYSAYIVRASSNIAGQS